MITSINEIDHNSKFSTGAGALKKISCCQTSEKLVLLTLNCGVLKKIWCSKPHNVQSLTGRQTGTTGTKPPTWTGPWGCRARAPARGACQSCLSWCSAGAPTARAPQMSTTSSPCSPGSSG
jgi:hypothetical protein